MRTTNAVRGESRVRPNRFGGKRTAEAVTTNNGVQGQAMVEFALVVGLLLLLLFAIVDFSRLFFAYATMAHGTREAARWGVVNSNDLDAIADLAESRMVVIGGTATVDRALDTMVPDTYNGTPNARCAHYCRLVVRATATLDVWTPVLPSVNLEAQATMHFE